MQAFIIQASLLHGFIAGPDGFNDFCTACIRKSRRSRSWRTSVRGPADDNLLFQGTTSAPDSAGEDCWLSRDPADLAAALQGPPGQAAVMTDG